MNNIRPHLKSASFIAYGVLVTLIIFSILPLLSNKKIEAFVEVKTREIEIIKKILPRPKPVVTKLVAKPEPKLIEALSLRMVTPIKNIAFKTSNTLTISHNLATTSAGEKLGQKNLLDGLSFKGNTEVFGLKDLDSHPFVLLKPDYKIPKSLIEQRMPDTTAYIYVIIHENGSVTFVDYEYVEFEELKPTIREIITKMRFNKPTRNGQPVKGQFLLPLNLEGL